jgi:hypothetical protein
MTVQPAPERAEVIRQMRLQGATLQEIATHLGVSRQRVHQLWPEIATPAEQEAVAARVWAAARGRGPRARQGILDAIRAWAERFGEPPTAADWCVTHARKSPDSWRLTRYQTTGPWPTTSNVQQRFGTWNAAIVAAGFAPYVGRRRVAIEADDR